MCLRLMYFLRPLLVNSFINANPFCIKTTAKKKAADVDSVQPPTSKLAIEPAEDVEVFENLKHRKAAQIEQLDEIFHEAGLTTRSTACERGEVVSDGNGNAFIRFVACELVPFSVETVLSAIEKQNGPFVATWATDDTLIEVTRSSCERRL